MVEVCTREIEISDIGGLPPVIRLGGPFNLIPSASRPGIFLFYPSVQRDEHGYRFCTFDKLVILTVYLHVFIESFHLSKALSAILHYWKLVSINRSSYPQKILEYIFLLQTFFPQVP